MIKQNKNFNLVNEKMMNFGLKIINWKVGYKVFKLD